MDGGAGCDSTRIIDNVDHILASNLCYFDHNVLSICSVEYKFPMFLLPQWDIAVVHGQCSTGCYAALQSR